jgi:thiamine biosynthesis lipoprotein
VSKRAWSIVLMLSLLALSSAAIFRDRKAKYLDEPYQKDQLVLDTLVTIKAYGEDKAQVEQAVGLAMKEIEEIDKKVDYYDPQSDISKLNKIAGKNSGKPTPASSDLIAIIETSKELSRQSGGAFDITLGPVIRLWNFNGKARVPPMPQLSRSLELVGMENVDVDRENKTVLFKNAGMSLDLGGVAKGYAADRAIAVLKRKGIKNALVTTGSTTVCMGRKADGKPWIIGIQHPRKADKTLGTLELTQKSLSTSGDYQRYFVQGGKRYHHILDPKTGLPAKGCRSVTVVTDRSCTEADILSTAAFVMGYPKGFSYLEALRDTEGVIVDSKGKVHETGGLKHQLSLTDRQ